MIFVSDKIKRDPVKRWGLPEETFFAAGACHILAHAFLERFESDGYKPLWIKPGEGYRGNHIFCTDGERVFDYQGFNGYTSYIDTLESEMQAEFPGWNYDLVALPKDVLVSESKSKAFDGLWLREPGQFLHDATPRAIAYMNSLLESV